MYHSHSLGPMCCLPLIKCTVHRPCCMICNRGPKEKAMGAPPGAIPGYLVLIVVTSLLKNKSSTNNSGLE